MDKEKWLIDPYHVGTKIYFNIDKNRVYTPIKKNNCPLCDTGLPRYEYRMWTDPIPSVSDINKRLKQWQKLAKENNCAVITAEQNPQPMFKDYINPIYTKEKEKKLSLYPKTQDEADALKLALHSVFGLDNPNNFVRSPAEKSEQLKCKTNYQKMLDATKPYIHLIQKPEDKAIFDALFKTKTKCPDCKGKGKIQLFTSFANCEKCNGKGVI